MFTLYEILNVCFAKSRVKKTRWSNPQEMICSRARNLKILSKFLFWSPQTTTTTLCSLEKHKSAFWKDFVSKVLYICVNCWRLAHKTRDLPQAETKRIYKIKAEQVHKLATIFTQNDVCLFSNLTILAEKISLLSLYFYNSNYFWFQLEINHVIHEPRAKT